MPARRKRYSIPASACVHVRRALQAEVDRRREGAPVVHEEPAEVGADNGHAAHEEAAVEEEEEEEAGGEVHPVESIIIAKLQAELLHLR